MGRITEEDLTNYFFTFFSKLTSLYILPSMFYVYSGSKICIITNNDNAITFDVNITFLFAPHTIVGQFRDFIEFTKYVDQTSNTWCMYCGRCTHLYSANNRLGCPCLQNKSSDDEGYDTD